MTAPPFLIANLFAPVLHRLTSVRALQVDMTTSESNAALTRREADLSIRIEDQPWDFKPDSRRIDGIRLPPLRYAIYAAENQSKHSLPWAGLIERTPRSSGIQTMAHLTGKDPVLYRAQHFDALAQIVKTSAARALLPDCVARTCGGLSRVSDTVLEQPLWLMFHNQDKDVAHLRVARRWIIEECKCALT